MSNHFLMVTSDGETANGKKILAHALVSWRLKRSLWPLYAGTKNRAAVRPGDKLAFYQGGTGPGRQTIIGWAEVAQVLEGRTVNEIDPHYSLSSPCKTALRLGNLVLFETPVSLRHLIGKLELLPSGMKHWGVIVMGGCRRLSSSDFETILEAAAE